MVDERSQQPRVTVVIPAYNQADTLERAIRSVIEQDYENKQIAVLNPNADTETIKVFGSMLDESDGFNSINKGVGGTIDGIYVRLFIETDILGPSAARNFLIQKTWDETDYFCMLDADDYYLPGKISKCVEKALYNPHHIGIVYNDLLIHHDDIDLNIPEYRQPYDRMVLERENIITNTPLISKAALEEVGLYDENLRTCEDWDLWLRITERFAAVHIPEHLSVYSVTGVNTTNTVSKEEWNKNWSIVQQKLRQRCGM